MYQIFTDKNYICTIYFLSKKKFWSIYRTFFLPLIPNKIIHWVKRSGRIKAGFLSYSPSSSSLYSFGSRDRRKTAVTGERWWWSYSCWVVQELWCSSMGPISSSTLSPSTSPSDPSGEWIILLLILHLLPEFDHGYRQFSAIWYGLSVFWHMVAWSFLSSEDNSSYTEDYWLFRPAARLCVSTDSLLNKWFQSAQFLSSPVHLRIPFT